jgi:hypothetical protein
MRALENQYAMILKHKWMKISFLGYPFFFPWVNADV